MEFALSPWEKRTSRFEWVEMTRPLAFVSRNPAGSTGVSAAAGLRPFLCRRNLDPGLDPDLDPGAGGMTASLPCQAGARWSLQSPTPAMSCIMVMGKI